MNEIIETFGKILQFLLGSLFPIGYLIWISGIRFTKASRDDYNVRKKEYRDRVEEDWRKYREENSYTSAVRKNTVDQYGNVLHSEIQYVDHDPGRRVWQNAFKGLFLVLGSLLVMYFLKEKLPIIVVRLAFVAAYFLMYKYLKDKLLYDRWYVKLVLSFWIFIFTVQGVGMCMK